MLRHCSKAAAKARSYALAACRPARERRQELILPSHEYTRQLWLLKVGSFRS
jgi:hypothetical protein